MLLLFNILLLLTHQQEIHLLKHKHNQFARDILITENLPLVNWVYNRYKNKVKNPTIKQIIKNHEDDLIQEGRLGLIKAIDRFNTTKNTRLSTYAKYWIDNHIDNGINKHRSIIYIPKSARLNKNNKKICNIVNNVKSLNYKLPKSNRELQDVVIVNSFQDYHQNMLKTTMKLVLNPEEELILSLKYGLYDGNVMSYTDISKILDFNCSINKIRRTCFQAILKLENHYKTTLDMK
jgi:RNA polymerase sigma factor (sigma-70 family)